MTADRSVVIGLDGRVGRIVLNRPHRHNAQTPQMWRELREAVDELVSDPDVRVLLVTGAGPSFSSGLDLDERLPGGLLHETATSDIDAATDAIKEHQANFRRWCEAPVPVVAAVHGTTIGAGLQLALSADIRFVANEAVLSIPEVSLGLIPDLGASVDLPRLVGLERALDLILTGRRFNGREAVELGLALRSVPAAELEEAALGYATALAQHSRLALGKAKSATRETDPVANLAYAARAQAECVKDVFGRGV
ncbi:enoyl-CoA hydratase/isomerase family protein [Microbacterium sp. RD1]|uniref:enoyl-CoA hydratase/isomerase family protein n=1 Tax=Microbacterium sp. RD1 TaxID=3457313 RepID=UPI003FA5A83C